MPKFSKRSLDALATCHSDLQKVARLAIQRIDFTIYQGHRTQKEQLMNLKKGSTQVMRSKHCEYPSRAFDFIPYPFTSWQDRDAFNRVGEVIMQCAKELGIRVRRGADWNMNGKTNDEPFYDGPHIELMSPYEIAWARKRYGNYIK